ncbi:MAG TPA: amidase [Alphaproteobacteria bacterium]|nr:amidase [Alphaproteobacteria bacterium]
MPPAPPQPDLIQLARDLAAGRTTAAAQVAEGLDAVDRAGEEGRRTFVALNRDAALAAAAASDALRRHGVAGPLAGLTVSIKDLFDVAGEVTAAGSKVLADAPPAAADAPAVARLRAAGAVPFGRTNMTEFAFSGLGLNPHHGTPANPFDPARIPGGSSSGAAVSVARGMAAAALGSDTGGSVRIPAAFCRLVGFKPSQARVPRDGAVPLSRSLDCVGPIARSVADCALLDSVLAGEPVAVPAAPPPLAGLRLGVPRQIVLDGLEPAVAAAFDAALRRLSAAGARIGECDLPELAAIPGLGAAGGFPAAEAYAWHRGLLERRGGDYDPRVSVRIRRGAAISAADYLDLVEARAALMAGAARRSAPFDALVMPTVAVTPPRFAELEADDDYLRINALVLRNTALFNMLDRPAISLPVAADLPVGLMLAGETGADRRLLALAAAVEPAVA